MAKHQHTRRIISMQTYIFYFFKCYNNIFWLKWSATNNNNNHISSSSTRTKTKKKRNVYVCTFCFYIASVDVALCLVSFEWGQVQNSRDQELTPDRSYRRSACACAHARSFANAQRHGIGTGMAQAKSTHSQPN